MSYVFHNKMQISKVNSTVYHSQKCFSDIFDPFQELICIAVCLNRRRFLVIKKEMRSLKHIIVYMHIKIYAMFKTIVMTSQLQWTKSLVATENCSQCWCNSCPPHKLLHKHCRVMRGAIVMLVLRLVSGSQGRVGTGGPSKCSELGQTWPVCPTDWPGLA